MKMDRLIITLIICCLASINSACAGQAKNITNRGDWEKELSSEKRSVVFGRIQWMEEGKQKKIGKGVFDFSITPVLLRIEDKSKRFGEVNENGEFVWALEPGTYVISRISYRDTWSGNYFIVPKVAFRVTDKGKIYNAGTLRADFAPKRDLIGGLSGNVKVTIDGQSQPINKGIIENIGMAGKVIEKTIMVQDDRLPSTIDTTAEFNMAIHILNAILLGLSH